MGSDRLPVLAVLAAAFLLSACGPRGEREKAFLHDGHLTITKGACAYCHGADPSRPRRALTADCAGCHRQAADPGKAGRYGVPAETPMRPPMRYEGVAFAHAPHSEAGIACATCHGAGARPGFPALSDCLGCHEAEGGPEKLPKTAR